MLRYCSGTFLIRSASALKIYQIWSLTCSGLDPLHFSEWDKVLRILRNTVNNLRIFHSQKSLIKFFSPLCVVPTYMLGGRDYCAGPGEDLQRPGARHAQVRQGRLAAKVRRCVLIPSVPLSSSCLSSLSFLPFLSFPSKTWFCLEI